MRIPLPQFDRYEWIAIAAVLFMGGLCLACLLIGFYGPEQVAIPGPSDVSFDASFEWSVPVGSPEIGVRPDGTVGSINEFGRISSV